MNWYLAHIFFEIAERYDIEVVVPVVMPDQEYVFVAAPPTISPAWLARHEKIHRLSILTITQHQAVPHPENNP